MENLIKLLSQKKKFSVKISYAIGREIFNIVHNSEYPLKAIINIHKELAKRSLWVHPLVLLDCYHGYLKLKDLPQNAITQAVWNDAIDNYVPEFKDKSELECFIETSIDSLEDLGNKQERRIQTLRELLAKYKNTAPLKIIHTGDLHFEDDEYLPETIKSAEFIINKVKEIKPDLAIIAGDIVHSRQNHDSPGLIAAVEFIKKLAGFQPVFIITGTKNHDGLNLNILKYLKTEHNIYISEQPEIIYFSTNQFFTTRQNYQESGLMIFSLPLTSIEHSKKHEIIKTWIERFSRVEPESQAIFVSHCTVEQAATSSNYIFNDIDFTIEDLRKIKAGLYLLGHIHRAQVIDGNIYYCGSIIRRNADEQEDKGFWVHEYNKKSEFIVIPTRKIWNIEVHSMEELKGLSSIPIKHDDIVKIKVKIKEGDSINITVQDIASIVKTDNIKIEKSLIPEHKVRVQGISKITDLKEKCRKTAELLNIPWTDNIASKIDLLNEEALLE